jgi:hypothetical protein
MKQCVSFVFKQRNHKKKIKKRKLTVLVCFNTQLFLETLQ